MKVFCLDIEVLSPKEFPHADTAKHPINLITIHDSISKKFVTFGTKPYTSKSPDVDYRAYRTEADMLSGFLSFWSSDYPDVVTGWNSNGFDIPYIINRITHILGEQAAKTLSPVGRLYYKADIAQQFGKSIGQWIIYGLNNLDYKEVYTKFSRGKQESYSLEHISNVELGEGKIKHNATSLAKLSASNWDQFVEYNIQDVNLLVKLEAKLRYLATMRIISHKGFL